MWSFFVDGTSGKWTFCFHPSSSSAVSAPPGRIVGSWSRVSRRDEDSVSWLRFSKAQCSALSQTHIAAFHRSSLNIILRVWIFAFPLERSSIKGRLYQHFLIIIINVNLPLLLVIRSHLCWYFTFYNAIFVPVVQQCFIKKILIKNVFWSFYWIFILGPEMKSKQQDQQTGFIS